MFILTTAETSLVFKTVVITIQVWFQLEKIWTRCHVPLHFFKVNMMHFWIYFRVSSVETWRRPSSIRVERTSLQAFESICAKQGPSKQTSSYSDSHDTIFFRILVHFLNYVPLSLTQHMIFWVRPRDFLLSTSKRFIPLVLLHSIFRKWKFFTQTYCLAHAQ